MTVAETFFLGRELTKFGFTRNAEMQKLTRDFLQSWLPEVDPDDLIGELTVSQQRIIEISKAVWMKPKILILDEPTNTMSKEHSACFLKCMKNFTDAGNSVLFTCHKTESVLKTADRITVLRDGRDVFEARSSDTDHLSIIKYMFGAHLPKLYPPKPARVENRETSLLVEDLELPGIDEKLSFELHHGEILGLSGDYGSRRGEAMEILCGFRPGRVGRVELFGLRRMIDSPADAIDSGLCYLSGARNGTCLDMRLSISENLTLFSLKQYGDFILDPEAEATAVMDVIEQYDIMPKDPFAAVRDLSGGNQQKLLFAKIMLARPRILIANGPSIGVDIVARRALYDRLRHWSNQGHSIIVISSEETEIVGLCDRALHMEAGRITSEYIPSQYRLTATQISPSELTESTTR